MEMYRILQDTNRLWSRFHRVILAGCYGPPRRDLMPIMVETGNIPSIRFIVASFINDGPMRSELAGVAETRLAIF